MASFMARLVLLALAAVAPLFVSGVEVPLTLSTTHYGVDYVVAGTAGLGNDRTRTITVAGVNGGRVTSATLYWWARDPSATYTNKSIEFNKNTDLDSIVQASYQARDTKFCGIYNTVTYRANVTTHHRHGRR
jgi:hypothetical protein